MSAIKKSEMDLPMYACHLRVSALKIERIQQLDELTYRLHGVYAGEKKYVDVGYGYFNLYTPQVGGYYLRTRDGTELYRTDNWFERNYHEI